MFSIKVSLFLVLSKCKVNLKDSVNYPFLSVPAENMVKFCLVWVKIRRLRLLSFAFSLEG